MAALALLVAALIAAAVAFVDADRPAALAAPADAAPELMLLTSLPIVFGEKFGLDETGRRRLTGSSALSRAADHRRRRRQPGRRQAAAGRAAARAAGRGWSSSTLGARRRPAAAARRPDARMAQRTCRWAIRCARRRLSPTPGCSRIGGCGWTRPTTRGPVERTVGGHRVLIASPGAGRRAAGRWRDGLVARCPIGKGRATIVADADFLDDRGVEGGLDVPATSTGCSRRAGETLELAPDRVAHTHKLIHRLESQEQDRTAVMTWTEKSPDFRHLA